MEINQKKLQINISKAKEGNQAAFRFLLDSFWTSVFNYQLKRTKNENNAEDITIQTFSKAFDKIHTFNKHIFINYDNLTATIYHNWFIYFDIHPKEIFFRGYISFWGTQNKP